jgi:excisionase family DNA binding protein
MKAPAETEKYLTTSQAAKITRVTRFTVANWVKNGKLASTYTAGGHRRISLKSLEEFIQTHCKSRPVSIKTSIRNKITGMIGKGFYDTGKFIGNFKRDVGGGIRYLSNEKK